MLNKRLATGLLLSGLICAAPAMAQSALAQRSGAQQSSKTSTARSATAKPAPAKSAAAAKKSAPKPLVYVEDNRKTADSSTTTTTAAGNSAKKPSGASASQKPLSSDIAKAFHQNCPDVALTESKARAAYDVTFEREPGSKGVKGGFGLTNAVHKTSKIEVMNKSGKELFSETGHSTGQLVKDACTAIGTPGTKVAKN
jgi:hypothetical protein